MAGLVDVGVVTVRKKMFPYFIIAAMIALLSTGGTGLYFGMEIQRGRDAKDKLELVAAQNTAMAEKELRRQEAEARSRLIEGQFLAALKGMKVENVTNYQETVKETEKLVYTDCKLPDSGVDLLNKHIDEVNLRLLGKGKEKK